MLDPALRIPPGSAFEVDMNAPRADRHVREGFRVVFDDPHVVVVDKPEGVSSTPYDRKETGTAMDLIRDVWRRDGRAHATRTPLYVVHRIDKDTSGLLCFAKTRLAEVALHRVFQKHEADRVYVAVAHGEVTPGRIESRLVADRGDGIRGSTRRPNQGQHAVTHVEVVERLRSATVVEVRLETGRTHQIRIHLAERGNPLCGETVYVRDWLRAGRTPLPSPRLLLHAATLGFAHPVTGAPIAFSSDPPPDFAAALDRIRGSRPAPR